MLRRSFFRLQAIAPKVNVFPVFPGSSGTGRDLRALIVATASTSPL
jgi:hypothetical protein